MLVWRDLDTRSALERFQILVVLSLVPLLVSVAFELYFISLGSSFFS